MRGRIAVRFAAAWLAAAVCVPVSAVRAESGPPKKVATVEGITEYRLDNGTRVLLFPSQSAAKITVNMTVLVGSRHEGYGETGTQTAAASHAAAKRTAMRPRIKDSLRKI